MDSKFPDFELPVLTGSATKLSQIMRGFPYTFLLDRDHAIYKIYNGWWFAGRPTVGEIRMDYRDLLSHRPDWAYLLQKSENLHPANKIIKEILADIATKG